MRNEEIARHLAGALGETALAPLGAPRRGKVRDIYERGDRLYLVATDRVSAFDRVVATIPFKGCVLTGLSAFWFERTRDVVPNHLVATPHPNVTVARRLRPVLVEMVVRAYITGVTSTSLWTHYARGERVVSGNRLPEGLAKNDPLPSPILTPSTKADQGQHDVTTGPAELVRSGVITAALWDELAAASLALFARGAAWCSDRGVILVDTKYEFGLDEEGRLTLMDELHTPDSSRFWKASTYEEARRAGREPEGFDKEYVRRWLKEAGFAGDGEPPPLPDEVRVEAARRYLDAWEQVTGRPFAPPYESAAASLDAWSATLVR